jgi:hypothetical protein
MEQPQSGVILLDVPPGIDGEFDVSFLERTGHPVVICHGPAGQLCPLLGGQGCPKYEAAHGIVFELDLDDAQHRAIIERYRAQGRTDLPIRVVVRPDQAERYRDTLVGIEVWTREPNVAELDGFAARVEAADFFAD